MSVQERQLRIIEKVEVGAAEAMLSHSNEKVPVMFPTLQPNRQVKARTAKLQTLPEKGVTQDLLTDLPQELNAVQSAGSSFFSNGFHKYGGVNRACTGEGKGV